MSNLSPLLWFTYRYLNTRAISINTRLPTICINYVLYKFMTCKACVHITPMCIILIFVGPVSRTLCRCSRVIMNSWYRHRPNIVYNILCVERSTFTRFLSIIISDFLVTYNARVSRQFAYTLFHTILSLKKKKCSKRCKASMTRSLIRCVFTEFAGHNTNASQSLLDRRFPNFS